MEALLQNQTTFPKFGTKKKKYDELKAKSRHIRDCLYQLERYHYPNVYDFELLNSRRPYLQDYHFDMTTRTKALDLQYYP